MKIVTNINYWNIHDTSTQILSEVLRVGNSQWDECEWSIYHVTDSHVEDSPRARSCTLAFFCYFSLSLQRYFLALSCTSINMGGYKRHRQELLGALHPPCNDFSLQRHAIVRLCSLFYLRLCSPRCLFWCSLYLHTHTSANTTHGKRYPRIFPFFEFAFAIALARSPDGSYVLRGQKKSPEGPEHQLGAWRGESKIRDKSSNENEEYKNGVSRK